MQTVFAFILLLFETCILSRIDRRRFGTWVTPFNVLSYPYVGVLSLILILGPTLDFVPIYAPSVLVWIIGLFLFWGSGTFLSWALLDYGGPPTVGWVDIQPRFRESETAKAGMVVGWLAVPIVVYGLISSVRQAGGWVQFGTEEFRESYSHGLHGHAEVLAALIVIMLIGIYKRGQWAQLVTIAALTIVIALSRSKGHLMEITLGGAMFRMFNGRTHFSWKKVVLVICISYLAFTSAYVLGASAVKADAALDGQMYQTLARHYFFYMSAGPLALSEAMRSGVTDVGGPWYSVFAPFINIYRAALGTGSIVEAGSTHGKGMITGLVGNAEVGVNVYTFFGTPYLYLGLFGAVLYVLVAGTICYWLLIIVKTKNNPWLTAAYCFVAGQLALGFFELYFWYLATYEILALGCMLAVCLSLFSKPVLTRNVPATITAVK